MPSARDIFVKCDELERLPSENRQNYLFELEWLARQLPHGCRVLQVGSMDGMRVVRLLEVRPDLVLTGLEIESDLVTLARQTVLEHDMDAEFVHGDATAPPVELGSYDYVICLNNTLGYIPEAELAVKQMKKLAGIVVLSVYGEKFDDELAQRYFAAIGLAVREIVDDMIMLRDFSSVQRFPHSAVVGWGGDVIETPIGYLTILKGENPST
jgi:SAM-dependent methyltransferase